VYGRVRLQLTLGYLEGAAPVERTMPQRSSSCRTGTLERAAIQELVALLKGNEFSQIIARLPGYAPDAPGTVASRSDSRDARVIQTLVYPFRMCRLILSAIAFTSSQPFMDDP
jgi:hypothetical protein